MKQYQNGHHHFTKSFVFRSTRWQEEDNSALYTVFHCSSDVDYVSRSSRSNQESKPVELCSWAAIRVPGKRKWEERRRIRSQRRPASDCHRLPLTTAFIDSGTDRPLRINARDPPRHVVTKSAIVSGFLVLLVNCVKKTKFLYLLALGIFVAVKTSLWLWTAVAFSIIGYTTCGNMKLDCLYITDKSEKWKSLLLFATVVFKNLYLGFDFD